MIELVSSLLVVLLPLSLVIMVSTLAYILYKQLK